MLQPQQSITIPEQSQKIQSLYVFAESSLYPTPQPENIWLG